MAMADEYFTSNPFRIIPRKITSSTIGLRIKVLKTPRIKLGVSRKLLSDKEGSSALFMMFSNLKIGSNDTLIPIAAISVNRI